MKALIVYVPSRTGPGAGMIPLGPMAAANIFMDSGVEVRIFNMFLDGGKEVLLTTIGEYKPDIVGYSGIASSYPGAKEVSHAIRAAFKDIIHMAGGPLASTYDLLLKNRVSDYVVHGEAEVNLPKLLSFLRGQHSLDKIGGISYLREGEIVRNAPEEQVKDLDVVKFPAYHLVNVEQYIESLKKRVNIYGYSLSSNKKAYEKYMHFIERGKDTYLEIVPSRGCTHTCLFCYRHVRGIRRHSVDYVMRHIRFLVEKYHIGGICFGDELFNSDIKWIYDLCDAIEGEFRGDFFYRIGGARANKVDKDLLTRLSATGCVEINYGQESGSPRILKEYRKGVTVEQNIEATLLAKEAGIFIPVQLVIGSPSETTGTIFETLRFLKKVNALFYSTSTNYLIPLPETPIWKHIMEKGLITDVEGYLERVARHGGMFDLGLNLTKSPKPVWKLWLALIIRRTLLNEAWHKKNMFLYIYNFFFGQVLMLYISKRLKRFFGKLF